MARIRNTSGQDRLVPWLNGRLVVAGAIVEVPPEDVTAFTSQASTWAPADDEAQELHDAMVAAAQVLESIEDGDPADVLEETAARDLIGTVIPTLAAEALVELIEAEQARPKPRSTVLAAAEKRLADLDDADPTPDPGTEPGHNDPEEG